MTHDDRDDEDWYDEDTGLEDSHSAPCPECGAAVYDDLDHCAQCGYWITDADHRALDRGHFRSRRVRYVALGILLIFLLMLALARASIF